MRLFVDNLTNVDFSYLCPARGLVGETWIAHLELEGELDHQGMVCDFGIVKKAARQWLDSEMDHRLVVPKNSEHISIFSGEYGLEIQLDSTPGKISVKSPEQAFCLAEVGSVTPHNMAHWCEEKLKECFGHGVSRLVVRFTEEDIHGPYYHYSHGLKKHDGNCQRIAHGHRSKIQIWRNGELCTQSMTDWAEGWKDIYIGTQMDCVRKDDTHTSFAYQAAQGAFELTLPTSCCYFIDQDSTVENIALHIATQLATQHPGEQFTVKAYEGWSKGAIAEAKH